MHFCRRETDVRCGRGTAYYRPSGKKGGSSASSSSINVIGHQGHRFWSCADVFAMRGKHQDFANISLSVYLHCFLLREPLCLDRFHNPVLPLCLLVFRSRIRNSLRIWKKSWRKKSPSTATYATKLSKINRCSMVISTPTLTAIDPCWSMRARGNFAAHMVRRRSGSVASTSMSCSCLSVVDIEVRFL